jgi:hypothetical protein
MPSREQRQAWRSGLAVLGIALGVALLVAVQATLGSAAQAFRPAPTRLLRAPDRETPFRPVRAIAA